MSVRRRGREGGRTEENRDDEEDDDEAAHDGHWDSDLQILLVPRLSFIHKPPNVSSHIYNKKKIEGWTDLDRSNDSFGLTRPVVTHASIAAGRAIDEHRVENDAFPRVAGVLTGYLTGLVVLLWTSIH